MKTLPFIRPARATEIADALKVRVRGEYLEMPGLSVTLPQACRLWQINELLCSRILEDLVSERFLRRTSDGAFRTISGGQ